VRITRELSGSFQIANLLGMILVVTGHYTTHYMLKPGDWNFLVQEFYCNSMTRSVVPFFALAAGLFLLISYNGLADYKRSLRNRFSSLFIPYVAASLVIFVISRALLALVGKASWNLDAHQLLDAILLHPVSVQFWYLRDLLLLIVISPLIFEITRRTGWLLSALLGVLWLFEIQPFPLVAGWYLVQIETLLFFSLGAYFAINIERLERGFRVICQRRVLAPLTVLWLALIALRIYIDPTIDLWYVHRYTLESLLLWKAAIIVGLPVLIGIASHVVNRTTLYLSSFTFFMFLFHLMPLNLVINKICNTIMGEAYAWYLSAPIALVTVTATAWFFDRHLPSTYEFLTGGRSVSKMMRRAYSDDKPAPTPG
jgi:peptidoglycan/LPS O-acetylase OafA/YrhL